MLRADHVRGLGVRDCRRRPGHRSGICEAVVGREARPEHGLVRRVAKGAGVSRLDRMLIGCMQAAAALVAISRAAPLRREAVLSWPSDRCNLAIESHLRTRLLEQDTTALRKEQEYASNLEAAQRHVRAGIDSLYCPAARPVPAGAARGDRSATAGPAPDGQVTELVPDATVALLATEQLL
jgi:hypothetical protein